MDLLLAPAGRLIRLACVVLMVGMAGLAFCQEAQISRGQQLMDEGKPAEAFALLEPLESANAGEVKFDYLFGIVALDSGHPDRATIAFERVLAVAPSFAGARLDLARAYFAMGSDDLAKGEFDTVMSENPPEEVRLVVARYREAIEQRQKRQQPNLLGYVEGNAGYDSNISAVTANFSGGVLQAYNIANVQPTGNSIKRDGYFYGYALGADYSMPLELARFPALSWYVGGSARERLYDHKDDNSVFNSQQFDASTGLAYRFEADVVRLGIQAQEYYQQGAALTSEGTRLTNDRRTFGYTGEWRHALSAGTQVAAFAQFNQQRFTTNNIQDIDQTLYGVQALKAFDARWNPLALVMAFQSRDRALRTLNAATSADVGKTITGLRLYGQVTPREAWDVFLSLGQTDRDDDSAFARSLTVQNGNDHTYDTTVGVNYRFRPTWMVRTQLTAIDNRSNIQLYEYKRTEFLVTLRKEFK